MSFLAPFFLWLLPLAAIPLIIHMLNRRNLITINFSTIRFLKLLENESIRKLQILQILLLILRTIIILFLVLMITRPVIKGILNLQNTGESTLHAVILDDSFSMKGNKNTIQNSAYRILEQIPDKNQLIWINLNGGLQFRGLREDVPSIENLFESTFKSGSMSNALHTLSQIDEDDITSRELYILTDAQLSSITELNNHSKQLESMNTYILVAPQLENNLSIIQLNLLNEIVLPNDHIEIEVMVQNSGVLDKENILLQLTINDMIVGQQLISLQSSTIKTFAFKTALPKSGIHKGMIELDADNRAEDNRFYFTINVPDKHNIAIISNSSEATYYIKESLKALNKFSETLSIVEYMNLEDKQLRLYEQDIVFILNPSILDNITDSKVEEYLYKGGHVIIFPNIESESSAFAYINNITSNISANYIDLIKQSLSGNSFQEINPESIQIKDIKDLFVDFNGIDRNIRMFEYIVLPFHPEFSKIQLNDGSPIWNRHIIQRGIIDVFGFAVNLNWTNFPIKGTFLPFTHFLLYSHTLNKKNLYKNTGDTWNHILLEYYAQTIYHIQPDGFKEILISNDNNAVSVNSLNVPGYHTLQTEGMDIVNIAVNTIKSELQSQFIDIKDIKRYIPDNIKVIAMEEDVLDKIKKARIGVELWRYFLYGTILLLILEMILSNAKKQR